MGQVVGQAAAVAQMEIQLVALEQAVKVMQEVVA
jgi:hypothetical protein